MLEMDSKDLDMSCFYAEFIIKKEKMKIKGLSADNK